jgi:hypothetical protein
MKDREPQQIAPVGQQDGDRNRIERRDDNLKRSEAGSETRAG